MIASVPNADGSIRRDANAKMAKPRTEEPNLIASTVALPLSTSLVNTVRAILPTIVTIAVLLQSDWGAA